MQDDTLHSIPARAEWKKRFAPVLLECLTFLAVFCGFLAENQRDAMADHSMELNYMQSLLADLEKDSV